VPKVILLLVCLALASAKTLNFVLNFRGTIDSKGNFYAKGNSQTITTLISPTDAIYFDVKTIMGSLADISGTDQVFSNSTVSISGNMTFGTHQFRENHVLYYQTFGLGRQMMSPSGDISVAATLGVTKGKGAFLGAVGSITINCDNKNTVYNCFLVGIVFLPGN